jgi:hypothetical protein
VRSRGTSVFPHERTGTVSKWRDFEVRDGVPLQPTETDEKEHERDTAQHTARGMKAPPPSQQFSSSFAAWIETWIQ